MWRGKKKTKKQKKHFGLTFLNWYKHTAAEKHQEKEMPDRKANTEKSTADRREA